jgi:hypothetical protein
MKIAIRILSMLFIIIIFVCQNAVASDYKFPGNNKVLLYAPGYSTSEDTQEEIFDEAYDFYFANSAHFKANITPAMDDNATVELVPAKSFTPPYSLPFEVDTRARP